MLRVLAERQYFTELKRIIKQDVVSKDVFACLTLYGTYFKRNPSVQRIDVDNLMVWMDISSPPKNSEEITEQAMQKILLKKSFDNQLSDDMIEDTRQQLIQLSMADEISNILISYDVGDLEEDLQEAIDEASIKYSQMSTRTHLKPIRKDIGTILAEQDDDNGLTLPLKHLNVTVAPLKEGDFVTVGAQNNTGKTALAVQMAVHFAQQLPPDAKILYLNNEGIGDHIILRTRQIALDLGKYSLETAFKSGIPVEEDYCKAINGDSYKIEVIDVHGINVSQVQGLLRRHKPAVVIYDMLDAVHGFGGGGMDVDRYKQLYAWCRAQCANPEYRHIGVALTQVSHDGHEHRYVPKHALEGSKVAKQSQTDVLIMVGMEEDKPNLRFIHTPRCKRTRKGRTEADSKFLCYFDSDVGKYVDADKMQT